MWVPVGDENMAIEGMSLLMQDSNGKGYICIGCCDCGLVHSIDVFYDKKKDKIIITFRQANELTERHRTKKDYRCEPKEKR